MKSLQNIINYMWADEAIHYFNDGAGHDDHIFVDLIKAKLYLKKEERWAGPGGSYYTDYLYAESPFDLGSEEDNAYRDLVDRIIKQDQ